MPDKTVTDVEALKQVTRDLFEQVEQANSKRITCMLTWFLLGFFSCALGHVFIRVIIAYAAG